MYRTNIETKQSQRFYGNTVVSMRPFTASDAIRAIQITARLPALAEWIAALTLSPFELLFYLILLFVVLGCFLDGISVVVLTVTVLPMVQQAGIDLLWFGIFIVLVVEMSQITPPVGFNFFVIQSLTGKSILYVARASLPFFSNRTGADNSFPPDSHVFTNHYGSALGIFSEVIL